MSFSHYILITYIIFHYCGSEPVSWYEFTNAIINEASAFEKFRVNQVEPILATAYPTPAKRPEFSVLNCEKLNKECHIHQPDWRAGLKNVITELYSS